MNRPMIEREIADLCLERDQDITAERRRALDTRIADLRRQLSEQPRDQTIGLRGVPSGLKVGGA